VKVEIAEIEERPDGAQLRYSVANDSDGTAWLVDDGWLAWRQDGPRIELVYARVPMASGAQPFGYFVPKVAELAPGAQVEREVSLTWPQPLSRLWNGMRQVDPEPGDYELAVRVGYGETPEPAGPELGQSAEAPTLAWQREAVSEAVALRVSPRPARP
jgi:hypothetical protein